MALRLGVQGLGLRFGLWALGFRVWESGPWLGIGVKVYVDIRCSGDMMFASGSRRWWCWLWGLLAWSADLTQGLEQQFGFQVLIFGFWIWDSWFRISESGLWISDFRFRISDLDFGFRISDFGLRISDFGFGFRMSDLGFGHWVQVVPDRKVS